MGLDKAALVAALEAALLSDAELAAGEAGWRELEDVFFGGTFFEVKEDGGPEHRSPADEEDTGLPVAGASQFFNWLECGQLKHWSQFFNGLEACRQIFCHLSAGGQVVIDFHGDKKKIQEKEKT